MIERYTLPEMGRGLERRSTSTSCGAGSRRWCWRRTPPRAGAGRRRRAGARRAAADARARSRRSRRSTQHDVIAFLTAWADNTTPRSAAAYVHFGLTSSDLLDTALAVQLIDATDVLLAKADALVAALRDHGAGAPGHAAGRPHARRPRRAGRVRAPGRRPRLRAWPGRGTGCARRAPASASSPISGAVGTYSLIDPSVEVARRRRPRACGRPTSRRRWCCATRSPSGCRRWRSSRPSARRSRWRCGTGSAPRCGSCRRRSASGQKGSSAMPHKKNPILLRADRRPGPGRARGDRAGHRGHPALARARHLALLDRAGLRCPTPRSPPTTCCT